MYFTISFELLQNNTFLDKNHVFVLFLMKTYNFNFLYYLKYFVNFNHIKIEFQKSVLLVINIKNLYERSRSVMTNINSIATF